MRQKQLVSRKLDQLENMLNKLNFKFRELPLSIQSSQELREFVDYLKEHVSDIQTLINNEGDEWR
jgi:NADP-dependent 3-hydroxy acid dehydrogenase YdfG